MGPSVPNVGPKQKDAINFTGDSDAWSGTIMKLKGVLLPSPRQYVKSIIDPRLSINQFTFISR